MSTGVEANRELAELAASAGESTELTAPVVESLVLFRVTGRWCAVAAADVREIALKGLITRVPQSAPHLVGVALLRGRLVPVARLDELLGREGEADGVAAPPTLPRLMVLSRRGVELAVVAEQAHGVAELELSGRSSATVQTAPFVIGELEWQGGLAVLLDTQLLIDFVMGPGAGEGGGL